MITKVRKGFNWGYIIGLWIGLGNAGVATMMGVSLKVVGLGFGIGSLVVIGVEVIRWKLSKKEELELVNTKYFE
jgi:hypothetical protein